MHKRLLDRLKAKEETMIKIRRYLHEHPELSFKEENTSDYIADFYRDMDVSVERNIGPRGIKVTIDSGKPGKTLAIRADFDALPIQEETGVPYASKVEGVMHACGHDAHTAYMLVLAETLAELKDTFKGKVVVIHQPAEEVPPGGAKAMIQDGVLEGVDHVLGLHVMSTMKTGTIYYRPGYVQTGRAFFRLKIKGSSGHGSSPHMANDAIVASSIFVTSAQTIVSRRLSPFDAGVVTIGSFDGQGQFNIIQDTVSLEGDIRGLTDQTKEVIETEIRRIVKGIEVMFDVECELDYQDDYPALYNDPEFTQYVADTLQSTDLDFDVALTESQPPSEDFAYYAKERPSSFIYAGAGPEDGHIYPHHHPKFNINEKSLLIAAQAVGTVVIDYLNQ
ncbi:M20 family metallopeptidase [Macrococcoides caseolyticum]|uniref:M20 family metallopeptidase n=1 Tax=Macrococcoides caseolyticum TaxID=69966 RepID=UPI0024BD307D|nr:M20 family metallopeptidase [Macrococcus caseolyticus]MDJ1089073.1 M20 family metallopeptidase [Macrococcus caseolyticus]